MTYFQAIVIAIVQGITEPFPVSSLGHAVLLPALLHWNIDERGPLFLPFLTMLHAGTLLALARVFWGDWKAIFLGLLGRRGHEGEMASRRLCTLLVLATIPAVLLGGLFEHKLRALFGSPLLVAGFLTLNGVMLIGLEWLIRKTPLRPDQKLDALSPKDALIIGCWQCLALLPGLSRSGATMNGGLTCGLDNLNAARFSLLMAQPIILAATAKECWDLRHAHLGGPVLVQSFVGMVVAGVTAFACSKFLLKLFHRDDQERDREALAPFGFYCIAMGLFAAFMLWPR
ncbi:undecaprenyl-diphosphate phosphatase [Formicincola oecophyllae]|uniref:Undecaprenyl-diphosphatase n=1 Tax=Formicincola oecophyllae TaxID=2558361 RepID=A0A4Y6UE13_9PROT|nr:undecaprenyl-diphosphate phosphatase [Formicincola oecophyllae]QDH14255.1 undecaprenyl-diphosphate phosphatase [Formicincola oecophyllae]